ncbi:nucleotide exchange factor GrpE [Halobacteriales archaeon QH_8_64_26]|nr:MAG: nucleotide exchange factor GrpE [Halobacteriales archaeon QH_8_64_26]
MSERDATDAEKAEESNGDEGTAGIEDDPEAGGERRESESEANEEPASAEVTVESEDIEDLTERVAAASGEDIAREIASLRSLVADLEARTEGEENEATTAGEAETAAEQIEELQSKLARKQADFENFKKRMDRQRAQERERATEDLVTRLLGVRDDLVRALNQEDDAEIRGGVESTLGEFDRVLDDEGVAEIGPDPGTEVDPQRHEVMLRVDSEHPEGTVAEVFRPGYEMGGKVLRPAQVTVSEGRSDADDGDDGE